MAIRGRPPKVTRYSVIPRGFDGCVYVAELQNGIVKVGFSRNPRTRLESLERDCRRTWKTGIARFYVSGNINSTIRACAVEREVHARLLEIGKAVRGNEFYTGVPFGLAVNLCRQKSRRADQPAQTL